MSDDEPRPFRWYGTPGDVQPDTGDVLVLRDSNPERYLLVHAAYRIRGRDETHLRLVVTRARIGDDGSIPEAVYERFTGDATVFYYTMGPPRHPTLTEETPHATP